MPNEVKIPAEQKAIDEMTLSEIADELHTRLRAMADDPALNPSINGYRKFLFLPLVESKAKYVSVGYYRKFGSYSLTKDQAGQYLHWLRSGYVGTHHDARRFFERNPDA